MPVPVFCFPLHFTEHITRDHAAGSDRGQAAFRPAGQVVEVEAEVVLKKWREKIV